MRSLLRPVGLATALCAAVLTLLSAGCSSAPSSKSSAPAASTSTAKCRGTLGFDVIPLSRSVRQTLGLSKDAKGAVVSLILPGGPAAIAGIEASDVVEMIGDTRLANDCEFTKLAYGRSCEPVKIKVRRGGDVVELTLVPVDEKPFLEKACAGGNLASCFREAWLQWDRKNPDPKTLELFASACTKGSGDACAYEGLAMSDDPDRARDAVPVLEHACELDSGSGCAHLAFLFATGKVVAKDDKRAAQLYRKSCEQGDAQGCYNAALMADEGRGVPRDPVRAAADYDEACELGSATACTNFGFIQENGKGVRADKYLALAYYRRGCDGTACQSSNLAGCVNVGRAYRDGIGTTKDEVKAAEIFREACDRKENKDDVHSAESGARACSLLGGLYLNGGSGGVEQNLPKGRELSEEGCERGDSFGCFNAGVVYAGGTGVDANPAKAAEFFGKACNAGDGEGCHELAAAYASGKGVAKDPKMAKTMDQRACELGFAAACGKKPPPKKKT